MNIGYLAATVDFEKLEKEKVQFIKIRKTTLTD